MATAPMLTRPEPGNDCFVIQTDASNTSLGAELTEVIDGEVQVPEFASRTMTSAERNYSVFDSSLRWLHDLKNPTGRLARWALELQDHDIQIEYRAGALNHVSDALSRMSEEFEAIYAICEFKETSDAWYKKIFKQVGKIPDDWPN